MVTCEDVSSISSFFSTLSCGSWIFAQLPQILTNYRNKSAEGISPSFLLLWFMGDFLSFTSCLLNDAVLKFQIYLSIFFLCNDVTLCFQYFYYNSVYPKRMGQYIPVQHSTSGSEELASKAPDFDTHTSAGAMHIRHNPPKDPSPHDSLSGGSSYDSINENHSSSLSSTNVPTATKSAIIGAFLNSAGTNGLPISETSQNLRTEPSSATLGTTFLHLASTSLSKRSSYSSSEKLGLVLAWGCTVVYMSSRCPQLYKNYQRKSVDGISPLLFGAALLGNLAYTLSILTSCEFVFEASRKEFFFKELPYILGSSGTIIFDIAYFYQKHIYRNAGANTSVIAMRNWDNLERRDSNDTFVI